MAIGEAPQLKVGKYWVEEAGARIKFWPIQPGTTAHTFVALPEYFAIAPFNLNVLAVPPAVGVFDIVMEFSTDLLRDLDELKTERVTEEELDTLMVSKMNGPPKDYEVPIVRDPSENTARISFAVPVEGDEFEGKLFVQANRPGKLPNRVLELQIKVKKLEREADLFIFVIVGGNPNKKYTWFQMKAVERPASMSAVPPPLEGVEVKGKVLRDNFQSGFKDMNRRTERLKSIAGGKIAWDGERKTLAMPIEWPLLFNATKSGFVPRGHMIRFKTDQVRNNLEPWQVTDIRMMPESAVDLSSKEICLDPGHGCVYAFAGARRSYEWFTAHKIADRMITLFTECYRMPAENVHLTRTAGFGMIEPGSVHAGNAPEAGANIFTFELNPRRVRVSSGAVTSTTRLRRLSDLLLTRHDEETDAAEAVTAADRQRLLDVNATILATIETRINTPLVHLHRRVRPGSIRWDAGLNNYVYTIERTNAPVGQVVQQAVALPIQTTDWFEVDDDMMEVLAERSAAWSIECENNPNTDANFLVAAKSGMRVTGARAYMKEKILHYLNVTAPHPYLNHGTKAWGPQPRLDFMNGLACDLYMTLHENAGGGTGGVTIVSGQAGANAPPDGQVRIAKIIAKYLDPLDRGTRSSGVTEEEPTNPVAMLHSGNHVRAQYAYVESEFMDAVDPDDSSMFVYERMVLDDYINTTAEQLVNAAIEYWYDPQLDFDTVKYKNQINGLW